MDFDDDLDSLLDLENEIAEEGTHKRSLADLQSQQDAARCLAGVFARAVLWGAICAPTVRSAQP